MKILAAIVVIITLSFELDSYWLKGRYKVVVDNPEERYIIIFTDSTYKKIMANGKEINGVVTYGNLIYLRDFESSLQVVGQRTLLYQTAKLREDALISFENKKADTISFCNHQNYINGPINWIDICQSSGRLIKIE